MSKRKKRDIRKVSRALLPIAVIDALALLLLLVARLSPRFAGWFNRTVGAAVRGILAHLTSWIPFSLAEVILFLAPLLIVGVAVYAYRRRCESWRTLLIFLLDIVMVFSLLLPLFAFGFGTGYYAPTLTEQLALPALEVNADSLYDTTVALVGELNAAADKVMYGEDDFSIMPYDRREMNDRLLAAYAPVCEAYPFIQSLRSRVKPVMANKLMSYTHITGVYSYYTGEANLNVHFPDYTLPFTAAHELAHQRGIAREEEANFVAFLVCIGSEDDYIRYSGALNLFEYLASALSRTDAKRYREVLAMLDARVLAELRAYSAFFEQYRHSKAADVSDAVNDTYLKMHGSSAGTASYGLVVNLVVAYYGTKK